MVAESVQSTLFDIRCSEIKIEGENKEAYRLASESKDLFRSPK
jgi:hypothetical protein